MCEPFPVVDGGWKTILADCPWQFSDRLPGPGRGAEKHYRVMSNQDIVNMPVSEITAPNAHLYLWTTNSFLELGFEVMRAWGFTPKTNIVWVKTAKNGNVRIGMGRYFRNSTEICLFGVKGKLMTSQNNIPNVIMAERNIHSKKPAQMYDYIRASSPEPRLELFARNTAENFSSWGDQALA